MYANVILCLPYGALAVATLLALAVWQAGLSKAGGLPERQRRRMKAGQARFLTISILIVVATFVGLERGETRTAFFGAAIVTAYSLLYLFLNWLEKPEVTIHLVEG